MKNDHERNINIIRVHAANWLKNSKAGALHYGITENEYKDMAWICIVYGILHGPVAPPPETLADDESCLSYISMVLGAPVTELRLIYALYLETYLMHPGCFAQVERNVAARRSAENGIEASDRLQ